MTEKEKKQAQRYEDTYISVMALYATLKDIGQFKVKRAQIRQGEVPAEALDFVCDVEIKARKASINPVSWHRVLSQPETFPELSKEDKQALGKMFSVYRLDVGGPYKKLYFKARNQRA